LLAALTAPALAQSDGIPGVVAAAAQPDLVHEGLYRLKTLAQGPARLGK
jgi:hypothetical protein